MKFWIMIEKTKGDFGQIRGTVLLCPFLEGLRIGTESGYYVLHAQYGISYAEIFDVVAAECPTGYTGPYGSHKYTRSDPGMT